jgi:cytoskeletal protein RodZ
MKSIGQVIRSYRERQQWSIQRLAKESSVPVEMLQALEEERFSDLPAAPLVRGYLQLIAGTLGIPEETAIALWRRDAPASHEGGLQPRSETIPFRGKNWWQPQILPVVGFLAVLLVVVTILTWQWQAVGRPPNLTVNSLENFAILQSPIVVTGRASPEATVTINTQLVSLDPQGNFSFPLDLPAGERTIVVQATDAQGRVAEAIYFVTVE